VGVARHLADDEEFRIPAAEFLAHGKMLFSARWTAQDGAGRPLLKGNGRSLTDRARDGALIGPEARPARGYSA